jgi:hypothetical protein
MLFGSIESIADNVPELLLHICDYLEPADIVRCMATCKTLARGFEPCLWQYFAVKNRFPSKEAMLRHRHQMRTLTIRHMGGYQEDYLDILAQDMVSFNGSDGSIAAEGNLTSEPITNLRAITFAVFPQNIALQETIVQTFVGLAHRCHRTLRTLTLPATALMQEQPLMKNALENSLPNLTTLSIGKGGFVPWDKIAPFLVGCFRHPRLTSLQCVFYILDHFYYNYQQFPPNRYGTLFQELEEAVKSKGTGASRIKDLRLPSSESGFNGDFLVPFLKVHGPHLERMGVPTIAPNFDPELEAAIEEHCPKLRHLSIVAGNHGSLSGSTIEALTRGCKTAGLQSFYYCAPTTIREDHYGGMIETLVEHHAETLEVIELEQGRISSEGQHLLLENCPNLKRMWVDPVISLSFSSYLIRVGNHTKDWACLGLKELRLTYAPDRPQSQLRSRSYNANTISSSHLYQQIGRLVQLEYFAIGRDDSQRAVFESDLTVSGGSLAELAGLKRLRHLHITTNLWSKMGQVDVEFIHQSWPVLQTITVGCNVDGFLWLKSQSHWAWLCEKRPWLEFTCSSS